MKVNQLILAISFLVPGMATAQQPASSSSTNTTNKAATNVFVQLDIEAGEQGDADAQYRLGWAYEYGRGVETNAAEAAKWYRKAAEQRHVAAQQWIRKKAESGDADAQSFFGFLFHRGDVGLDTDSKE